MKTSKLIAPFVTGVLFAAAANTRADIDIIATGSTAFRNASIDAIKALFDGGLPTTVGNSGDAAFGVCYYGTMSNTIPAFGSTVVQFHATFSGSAQGLIDVYNHNLIGVTMKDGTTTNLAPDLAFTDNWPEAQTPPLKKSQFDTDSVLGVNVFTFVVNDNLYNAGLTNITRENARYVMTATGDVASGGGGMPANYLGASITNTIYLLGRDIGSGTRITTFACIGNSATPTQWATNYDGSFTLAANIAGATGTLNAQVKTNLTLGDPANGYALDGYDSGGTLVKILNTTPNTIGYAGYPDATGNGSTHKILTFEGVAATPANVESGAYPFWSYEHLFSVGNVGGSANKQSIKAALVAKVTSATFQNTDANYNGKAAKLANMQVKRLVDGGPIQTVAGSSYGF